MGAMLGPTEIEKPDIDRVKTWVQLVRMCLQIATRPMTGNRMMIRGCKMVWIEYGKLKLRMDSWMH